MQKPRPKCSKCNHLATGRWKLDPDIPGVPFCKRHRAEVWLGIIVKLIETEFPKYLKRKAKRGK